MAKYKQSKSTFPISIKQEKSIYVPALYSLKQLRKLKENMLNDGVVVRQSIQCKKEYIEECEEEVDEKPILSKYEIYDKSDDIDMTLTEVIEKKIPTTTKIKVIDPIKKETGNSAIQKDMKVPENVKKELTYDDNYLALKPENKIREQMPDIRIENLRRELLKEVVQVENKMKCLIKKEREIVEKEKKIEIVLKEKEKFSEKFVSLAVNISEKEKEISELVSKNEKKISLLKLTVSEKDELEKLLQCEKDKVNEISNRNDQLSEQFVSLAVNISQKEREISELASENEKKVSLLELTVSEKDELENLLQCEKDKVSELSNRNDQLIQLHDISNDKNDSLRSEIDIVSKEKEKLAEQFISLALNTSQRENKTSGLISENEKKISLLEATVSEDKSNFLKKNKLIIEFQNRINSLEETNICNSSKIDSLVSELDTVLKEKEELAEKNKYLSSKEKEMTVQISENNSNFLRKDELNINLQNRIDELENINCKLVKSDADNTSTISSLRLELNKFANMEKEISSLESQISEYKQNLLITKELNDKLQHEFNDLEKIYDDYNLEINKLKSDLEEEKINKSVIKQHFERICKEKDVLIEEKRNLNENKQDKTSLSFEYIDQSTDEPTTSKLLNTFTSKGKPILKDNEPNIISASHTKEGNVFPDKTNSSQMIAEPPVDIFKKVDSKVSSLTSLALISESNTDNKLSQLTSQTNTCATIQDLKQRIIGDTKVPPLTPRMNISSNTLDESGSLNTTLPLIRSSPEKTDDTLIESFDQDKESIRELIRHPNEPELVKEDIRSVNKDSSYEKEGVEENESKEKSSNVPNPVKPALSPSATKLVLPVTGIKRPFIKPPTDQIKSVPLKKLAADPPLVVEASKELPSVNNKKNKSRRAPITAPDGLQRGHIYIKNLPSLGLTQDDVRHHFSQFGKVIQVNWSFNNKKKNQFNNYCFVTFDSEMVSDKLIKLARCRIKGYAVDIGKPKYAVDSKKSVQRNTDQGSNKAWVSPWMENTTFQQQSSRANQDQSQMSYQHPLFSTSAAADTDAIDVNFQKAFCNRFGLVLQ